MDYFTGEEHPENYCDNILPYGIIWQDVPTSFLDAFVNHSEHIICFALDYYLMMDEEIDCSGYHVSYPTDRFKYFEFKGTKRELFESINTGKIVNTHTKISMLRDDIVILSKIDEGKYIYYWYHLSGRCDIGRFQTTDDIEIVKKSVAKWLSDMKEDDCIKEFYELSVKNFFEGWVSF